MWGVRVGRLGDVGKRVKTPPEKLGRIQGRHFQVCVLGLYQAQFNGAFNGRPAAVDVELAVDALGVCANRA